MSNLQDHLPDVDFRTHEERRKAALTDFVDWYEKLTIERLDGPSERIEGQITMLSAVLWYLLEPNEYKKLTKRKTT